MQAEVYRLRTRQVLLRAALASQNVSSVPFAVVKTVLTKFHRLMETLSTEQQERPLYMMVRRTLYSRFRGRLDLTPPNR
jgi:hypothetical protein